MPTVIALCLIRRSLWSVPPTEKGFRHWGLTLVFLLQLVSLGDCHLFSSQRGRNGYANCVRKDASSKHWRVIFCESRDTAPRMLLNDVCRASRHSCDDKKKDRILYLLFLSQVISLSHILRFNDRQKHWMSGKRELWQCRLLQDDKNFVHRFDTSLLGYRLPLCCRLLSLRWILRDNTRYLAWEMLG